MGEHGFDGKRLLDIGCANGFFAFRFLQSGGKTAVGIEKDMELVDFCNWMAFSEKLDFVCLSGTGFMSALSGGHLHFMSHFDIGLYLDLHFHEGIDFIDFLANRCNLIFASCAGDGNLNNGPMRKALEARFSSVIDLWDKTYGRMIYRCEK